MTRRFSACLHCTQLCYRTHGHGFYSFSTLSSSSPSFFASFQAHSMRIPTAFLAEMEETDLYSELTMDSGRRLSSTETQLEGPSGQIWPVSIGGNGKEDLFFTEGWEKFASDHFLIKGDLLVFKLVSKGHFSVNIYGKDGSEKESALVVKNSGTVPHESRNSSKKRKAREYEDFDQSKKSIIGENDPCQHVVIDLEDEDEVIALDDGGAVDIASIHGNELSQTAQHQASRGIRISEKECNVLKQSMVEKNVEEPNSSDENMEAIDLESTAVENVIYVMGEEEKMDGIISENEFIMKKTTVDKKQKSLKGGDVVHHQETEVIGMKLFHEIEDVAKMDFVDDKKPNIEASSQGLDEPHCNVKNTDISAYVSCDGGDDDNTSEYQCQTSLFSLAGDISRGSQSALKFEESLSQDSYNKEGCHNMMDSFTKDYLTDTYISQRRLISVAEREKPLIAASCFTSSRPFVTKLMKESHVYRGFWMAFPAGFSIKYLPVGIEQATLVDSSGQKWVAKWIGKRSSLSGGWRKFSRDHGLDEGDVCVFEVIDRIPLVIKVHIYRVVEVQNNLPGRDHYLRKQRESTPTRMLSLSQSSMPMKRSSELPYPTPMSLLSESQSSLPMRNSSRLPMMKSEVCSQTWSYEKSRKKDISITSSSQPNLSLSHGINLLITTNTQRQPDFGLGSQVANRNEEPQCEVESIGTQKEEQIVLPSKKYFSVERLFNRRKGIVEEEFLVELECKEAIEVSKNVRREGGAWWVPLSHFTKDKLSCHL